MVSSCSLDIRIHFNIGMEILRGLLTERVKLRLCLLNAQGYLRAFCALKLPLRASLYSSSYSSASLF